MTEEEYLKHLSSLYTHIRNKEIEIEMLKATINDSGRYIVMLETELRGKNAVEWEALPLSQRMH